MFGKSFYKIVNWFPYERSLSNGKKEMGAPNTWNGKQNETMEILNTKLITWTLLKWSKKQNNNNKNQNKKINKNDQEYFFSKESFFRQVGFFI